MSCGRQKANAIGVAEVKVSIGLLCSVLSRGAGGLLHSCCVVAHWCHSDKTELIMNIVLILASEEMQKHLEKQRK